MRHSLKVGFSFGTTSGIITTLGLLVGLYAGTGSRLAVLGGIITIAIADALSDAMGIHISEESEGVHSQKEIWQSTLATFSSKFLVALTFVIPFLVFGLAEAVVASVIWGLFLITALSFYIARQEGGQPWKTVAEHLLLSIFVVVVTYYVGEGVAIVFS